MLLHFRGQPADAPPPVSGGALLLLPGGKEADMLRMRIWLRNSQNVIVVAEFSSRHHAWAPAVRGKVSLHSVWKRRAGTVALYCLYFPVLYRQRPRCLM